MQTIEKVQFGEMKERQLNAQIFTKHPITIRWTSTITQGSESCGFKEQPHALQEATLQL